MRVCVRVSGLFVCACMRVLQVVVYAFAVVCCKVASHIFHLCRLHVCVAFVFFLFSCVGFV